MLAAVAHLHAHVAYAHGVQVKRPVVLVGASVGAATAIDFAAEHPEAVSKLVIIDGQVFVEGLGPMSSLPRWVAALGVQVRLPGGPGLRAQNDFQTVKLEGSEVI